METTDMTLFEVQSSRGKLKNALLVVIALNQQECQRLVKRKLDDEGFPPHEPVHENDDELLIKVLGYLPPTHERAYLLWDGDL